MMGASDPLSVVSGRSYHWDWDFSSCWELSDAAELRRKVSPVLSRLFFPCDLCGDTTEFCFANTEGTSALAICVLCGFPGTLGRLVTEAVFLLLLSGAKTELSVRSVREAGLAVGTALYRLMRMGCSINSGGGDALP